MQPTWCNAIPIIEYFAPACILVLVLCLFGGIAGLSQAVSLSITGHCAGSGVLALNYTGDTLNVSILQNGTAWLINATSGVA
jgi:putative effector of murein hydrolase LrgA (UPF0299 family)